MPTEIQHFVPRFYLKRFADSRGFVQVLDLKNRRVGAPRPYASVCYQSYFYAVETGKPDEASQVFEEYFTALEGQISVRFPSIIARAEARVLTTADADTLAFFLSLQWLRTDFFRQRLFSMEEDVSRRIFSMTVTEAEVRRVMEKHGRRLTDEQVQKIVSMYRNGNYSLKLNNSPHLRFLTPDHIEGFRNLFLAKQWNVISRGNNSRFITSDNPVAEWIPLRTSVYGAAFTQRKHYLALSPDLLIETTEGVVPELPDDLSSLPMPDPIGTLTYQAATDVETMMFNLVLVDHSGGTYCYGQRRDELDELLRTD